MTANARCTGTGPGLVNQVPGWSTTLLAEGSAKRLGEGGQTASDIQELSMDSAAPERCGAELRGTARLGSDGLGGVTAELRDGDGNPVLDAGQPVTTTTADDGSYNFGPLLPGRYSVRFLDHAIAHVEDATVSSGGSGTTTASGGAVLSVTTTLAIGDTGVVDARYVDDPTTPDRSTQILSTETAVLDPYSGTSAATASTGSSIDASAATTLCDPASSPLDCSLTSLDIDGEGSWTVEVDGTVHFVPVAGFKGRTTTIAYRMTDRASKVAAGKLHVVVIPPPTVPPASSTGSQGEAQDLKPLADWTPESHGEPLDLSTMRLCGEGQTPPGCSALEVTVPNEGRFTVNDDGSVTFQPEPNFVGDASPLRYQIADTRGQVASATLHPHVDPSVPSTTTTTPG